MPAPSTRHIETLLPGGLAMQLNALSSLSVTNALPLFAPTAVTLAGGSFTGILGVPNATPGNVMGTALINALTSSSSSVTRFGFSVATSLPLSALGAVSASTLSLTARMIIPTAVLTFTGVLGISVASPGNMMGGVVANPAVTSSQSATALLTISVPIRIPLGGLGSSSAIGSLSLILPIPFQSMGSISITNNLALVMPITLQQMSSLSATFAQLTAPSLLQLASLASNSQTQTGALSAITFIPMDALSALSHTDTLSIGAGPVLGLSPLNSLSAMLGLVTAYTYVPLTIVASNSSLALSLTSTTQIPLNTLNGVSLMVGGLSIQLPLTSLAGISRTAGRQDASNLYLWIPYHPRTRIVRGGGAREVLLDTVTAT